MQENIKVYDLTPFSAIDYPETLCAILWLAGCNMKCSYCHNSDVVFGKNKKDFGEVISFLQKRVHVLDGVSICGGEPTLHHDIVTICKEIKNLGYKVKIDTNGSKPDVIKDLLDLDLLDYVALDFKATQDKYKDVTKSVLYENLLHSFRLINHSKVEFEVRTTVHSSLLNSKDIVNIANILKNLSFRGKYFIQNFINSGKTIGNIGSSKKIDFEDVKLSIPFEIRNL